jgi:DNA-binding XRE family transcriptional regulator
MKTITTENKRIGQCLKDARKALQISRKHLGQKPGINRHCILSYEIGTVRIPTDMLTDLLCGGVIALVKSKHD